MSDPEKYRKMVGPLNSDGDEEHAEKKSAYKKLLPEDQDLDNAGLSCLTYSQVKEDRIALRVFKEIQGWCVTQEARESFWWWQLRFAREQRNDAYLPKGSTMKDSWVSKRASEMLKSQRDDYGRKTSFGSRFAKTRADNRSRNDLCSK